MAAEDFFRLPHRSQIGLFIPLQQQIEIGADLFELKRRESRGGKERRENSSRLQAASSKENNVLPRISRVHTDFSNLPQSTQIRRDLKRQNQILEIRG